MSKPLTKQKVILAVIVATLLAVALIFTPVIIELNRIAKVRDQYRLDDAVYTAVISDTVHKPTAEYVLDPLFLERYGLNSKSYLDEKGYFAPTGAHWTKWNVETKTAAVLMWQRRTDYSSWQIRDILRLTDDYYARNELTTPVVKVVEATTKL